MSSHGNLDSDKHSAEEQSHRDSTKEDIQKQEEGIISKIADGVKEFVEAIAAGERNVIKDSLNHPASGQADLIATSKKALEIGERLEAEKNMRKF